MENVPFISIVMGYFNRKSQCMVTLDTIERSKISNRVEVIIVDDGSTKEHDLTEYLNNKKFSFPVKLFKIDNKNKSWCNPSVAYNVGLEHAKGEWIIIQNPEVCHVDDICDYVSRQTDHKSYHAFQVYACDSPYNNQINDLLDDPPKLRKSLGKSIRGRWYCHPTSRPKAYHFCTAIHRKSLNLIGGFNIDMKNGIDFDDDEILTRISRICSIKFVPLLGIHLWHPRAAYQIPGWKNLHYKNKEIFLRTVQNKDLIFIDRFGQEKNLLELYKK